MIKEKVTMKHNLQHARPTRKGETISPAAAEASYPTPLEG
jgi:hypothetical protein